MDDFYTKKFTTGEYAKIHGLNKRTLMYYDEIGLFHPAHIGKNGYRFYDFKQHSLLDAILLLRNIKVPLKDIKSYLNEESPSALTNLLSAQSDLLEKQIEELRWLQKIVNNKIKNIEATQHINFSKLEIVDTPAQSLIASEEASSTQFEKSAKIFSDFIKSSYDNKLYSGAPPGALVLTKNIIKKSKEIKASFFFQTEKPESFVNIKNAKFISRPACRMLVAHHKGDWQTTPKTYEKMLDYIKKNNLEIGEYAFEERTFVDIIAKDFNLLSFKVSIELKD